MPSGDPHHDEMTDSELDCILVGMHNELLAHVSGAIDPIRALVAIMADNDQAVAQEQAVPEAAPQQLASQRLSTVIAMRHRAAEVHHRLGEVVGRARDLAIDLDRELNNHGDLVIAVIAALAFARRRDRQLAQLLGYARDLAIEITRDLIRIRHLDRELMTDRDLQVVRELSNDLERDQVFNGIRELDRAMALNRQLAIEQQIMEARELSIGLDRARRLSGARVQRRYIDRADAHQIALAIDTALVRARDLAATVMYRLNAFEVDAASADLSRVRIYDPALLTGVIWTADTVWPPDIASCVGRLSRELTPGIYQVRPGGFRCAAHVGRHAADRLPAGR